MHPQIDPQPETLGHVIADKKPVVPLRQRSYAWEKEEVTKLFQDFWSAVDHDQDYFLGLIVVAHQPSKPPEVVDGQQRLATTVILLAAIRDHLEPLDPKMAAGIDKEFLQSYDLDQERDTPHLRLNIEDDPYLVSRVLSKPNSAARKVPPGLPSHRRIDLAARLAAEHVATLTQKRSPVETIKILKKWVSFIKSRARVIWFSVPTFRDAYIIFETLNDRGLELSKSDLLKNYLFSCVQDREQEPIYLRWSGMLGALRTVTVRDDITATYVRHYWITRVGPVREDALYDSIKDHVHNGERAMELAKALQDSATVYAALLNSDHNMWAEFGTKTRRNLSILLMLNMERMRPLLLSVVSSFGRVEAKKAIALFVSWAVRWIVAGTAAGTMEQEFGKLAKEVTDGAITTAKQLAKAATVIPTDAKFEDAFAVARSTQMNKARYLLRALENRRNGMDDPWQVTDDEEVLTLEHIWPENPDPKDLRKMSPDKVAEMSELVTRIGNMALMRKKPNEECGNQTFAAKLPLYAKEHGMTLTAMLTKYKKWTRQEIDDRQRYLAKLAVETWPIDVK